MKVLFVTSEHPAQKLGGLGTFTKEYVKVLRKYCSVVVVYFHFGGGEIPVPDSDVDYVLESEYKFSAFSIEAKILESAASLRAQLEPIINLFKPDLIHCNDRQTYLPFRFDRNVCYSSHLIFCDLLSLQSIDDSYFQELKIEKTAITNSAITFFYSDFAQKRGAKIVPKNNTSVVIPLGMNPENFIQKKKHQDKKIVVSYFGRFENIQKGYLEFICAVNTLGKEFKETNNIEYNLFGSGIVKANTDISLFDKIQFLQNDDLYNAYEITDIVVMPSKYEPFGLTGLEAMASGCLLLVTSGLGMDMYAKDKYNCLSIPKDSEGISRVLKNAIWNFDEYESIRENAIQTAKNWTWERSVKAHLYFYKLIDCQRQIYLEKAYPPELYNMLSKKYYDKLIDQQLQKNENDIINQVIEEIYLSDRLITEKTILIINSLNNKIVINRNKLNIKIININDNTNEGILYRPECLPFENSKYDYVIASNLFESCMNIDYSINEIFRISKDNIYLIYYKGKKLLSQTYQIESDEELIKKINDRTYNWIYERKKVNEKNIHFSIISWKKQKERFTIDNRMVI